eukprot:scaffold17835_cov58-Phaeocystis_antarctica.AAC.8
MVSRRGGFPVRIAPRPSGTSSNTTLAASDSERCRAPELPRGLARALRHLLHLRGHRHRRRCRPADDLPGSCALPRGASGAV